MDNLFSNIKIQGPFWEADAAVIRVNAPAATTPVVLLTEQFGTYPENSTPFNWRETEVDFSLNTPATGRFKTQRVDNNIAYGSSGILANIHTHFNSATSAEWTNYIFSGKMRVSNTNGKMGVTFFSQYRENGQKRYYRLGLNANKKFELVRVFDSNTPAVLDTFDTFVLTINTYYRFHIEADAGNTQTVIRVKVWKEGDTEPVDFQLEATDTHPNRLRKGTVGIWTSANGQKVFDDFQVQGIGRVDFQAFYRVFLDHPAIIPETTAVSAFPGTLVAICDARSVRMRVSGDAAVSLRWDRPAAPPLLPDMTAADIRNGIRSGRLSLLLLRSHPAVADETPVFTCLNGYISLDTLQASDNAQQQLFQTLGLQTVGPRNSSGKENLPGNLYVHSSGAGVLGAIRLPWMPAQNLFAAPFQLVRYFPDDPAVRYRLRPDTDRFTAEETQAWTRAWQQLSVYVNPTFAQNPVSLLNNADTDNIPAWSVVELSDLFSVPRIFWLYEAQAGQALGTPLLSFEKGSFVLYLSEQQLYNEVNPPGTVVQIIPDSVRMPGAQNGLLQIVIETGELAPPSGGNEPQIGYLAARQTPSGPWTEALNCQHLNLHFDPVETPRQLRQNQALPTPEWGKLMLEAPDGSVTDLTQTVEPALLWGFMPLEDGWAQLPVLNLTEQIYLDAELDNEIVFSSEIQNNTFRGAVTLSNKTLPTNNPQPVGGEQNWDLTIFNARHLNAILELAAMPGDVYQLARIDIQLQHPKVVLNGFMWWSNGRPRVEDALPDLNNWVSGLYTVSLRSIVEEAILFPPALVFELPMLELQPQVQPDFSSAALGAWELRYLANADLLQKMADKKVMPPDVLAAHKPIIWQRAPFLPTVQALPLTQTKNPPNYPSASRQLAPFYFPVPTNGGGPFFPENWLFEAGQLNGANNWLRAKGPLHVAAEWRDKADLPMTGLSLPGLVFDPAQGLSDGPAWNDLRWQFRLDLPYLDEIHALAQLPRKPQKAGELSPLPASPPPPLPQPLQRADLEAFWDERSNQANLASADAVDLLHQPAGGGIVARNLVEPREWPVGVAAQLNTYPGSILLENTGDTTALLLQTEQALKGISGKFAPDGDEGLTLLAPGATATNAFEVTAHSMAAQKDAQTGNLRDQRGLSRGASMVSGAALQDRLLQTPVFDAVDQQTYQLSSLLQSLELTVPVGDAWSIWFKDLPLEISGQTATFLRKETRSPGSEDKDNNDPEALSSRFNFLQGYEWRINYAGQASDTPYLKLLNLHFYPLSLDTVRVDDGKIRQVALTGRLQLPLAQNKEQEELNNVVRIVFDRNDATGRLELKQLIPLAGPIEWPLEVFEINVGESPRLNWTGIDISGGHFVLKNPVVHFVLFQNEWQVPLEDTSLATGQQTRVFAPPANAVGIHPFDFNLSLDLSETPPPGQTTPQHQHRISISFDIALGAAERRVFDARVRFTLAGNQPAPLLSFEGGRVFRFINIVPENPDGSDVASFTRQAFQFNWKNLDHLEEFQFMPGIRLNPVAKVLNPGFATLSFSVLPAVDGIPQLSLQLAFAEILFSSRWSAFLQNNAGVYDIPRVFDATAGEMTIGYTTEYKIDKLTGQESWTDNVLLNGFLEVKNLLSWPASLPFDPEQQTVAIPNAADPAEEQFRHVRHSLRILLNQHTLPIDLLQTDTGLPSVLFTLKPQLSWQFLTVVEHQVIELDTRAVIDATAGNESPAQVRWTALQEVRWVPPGRYRQFVQYNSGKNVDLMSGVQVIDPAPLDPNNLPVQVTIRGRIVNLLGNGVPNLTIKLYARNPQGLFTLLPQTISTSGEDGRFMFENLFIQGLNANTKIGFEILTVSSTLVSPSADALWSIAVGSGEMIFQVNVAPQNIHYLTGAAADYMIEALHPDNIESPVLIVEASAPHYIRSAPLEKSGFTQLQFLPNGLQSAILSNPDDFGVSDPQEPLWQLMRTPFIGRLQPNKNEFVSLKSQPGDEPSIHSDPVMVLYEHHIAQSTPPSWALSLTSWADTANQTRQISQADLPEINRWMSLDAQSLEESWLRLQLPTDAAGQESLTSITATNAGSAAQLSRAQVLRRVFAGTRTHYPPVIPASAGLPEYGRTGALVWREDSLLDFHNASLDYPVSDVRTSWLVTALHFRALLDIAATVPVKRFPAATVLPHPNTAHVPMVLAVSPYEGFDFAPASAADTLAVVAAELLCLNLAGDRLQPVASKLWEIGTLSGFTENNYEAVVREWARETHSRLCPESPIAVLRFRNIEKNESADNAFASIVTRYFFRWVEPVPREQLLQKVFNLRTAVERLRFREGQFSGYQLPATIQSNGSGAISDDDTFYFELAPPQVSGVQPLYITVQSPETAAATLAAGWPWGLSALRLHTRFTQSGQAVIGRQAVAGETGQSVRMWWQAVQHFAQFRSSSDARPRAGLPNKYKARAISSLLPVIHRLPLPVKAAEYISLHTAAHSSGIHRQWQPVLPGAIGITTLGGRAGAPFVFRHVLIRQLIRDIQTPAGQTQTVTDSFSSGSVPVQHRMPRPVPLPPNHEDRKNVALQTWAGYYQASDNQYAEGNPVDEAYFAAFGNSPDRTLTMRLNTPAMGAVTPDWDGRLEFALDVRLDGPLVNWKIAVELEYAGKYVAWARTSDTSGEFTLDTKNKDVLQEILRALKPGDVLNVQARVHFLKDNNPLEDDGFRQKLRFSMRFTSSGTPQLPLKPTFVHFEDPEYNRRLASASGHSTRLIKVGEEFYSLRLSTDRKVYNPDSTIFYRFDWDPELSAAGLSYSLKFKVLDRLSGALLDMTNVIANLSPGKLYEGVLPAIMAVNVNKVPPISNGNAILLELSATIPIGGGLFVTELVMLAVDITTEPVIPVSESAYALLRSQAIDGEKVVDCPRFAWSPDANRIELVCPDDLTTEIVRRRAVFQWTDAVRPGRDEQYGVQKIAAGGATHFPEV